MTQDPQTGSPSPQGQPAAGGEPRESLFAKLHAGEAVRVSDLEPCVGFEEMPVVEGWRCPSCGGTASTQTGMLHDCCGKVTPVAVCSDESCEDEEPLYGLTPHDADCEEGVLIDVSNARWQGLFEDRTMVLLPPSAVLVLQQCLDNVVGCLDGRASPEHLYDRLIDLAGTSARVAGTVKNGQMARADPRMRA